MKELFMTFKKRPVEQIRAKKVAIAFLLEEYQRIVELARVRDLTVTEYIRRAALGRKADVTYENQIILELREVLEVIRLLHKMIRETGSPPPEAAMRLVFDHVIDAMLRIEK